MCAVGCRKALELAVKWVYAIDNSISMPTAIISLTACERSFMEAVAFQRVWRKLIGINKLEICRCTRTFCNPARCHLGAA